VGPTESRESSGAGWQMEMVMAGSKRRWRSVDEQLWQREDARVHVRVPRLTTTKPSGNVQK